jgi:hypothetical protein
MITFWSILFSTLQIGCTNKGLTTGSTTTFPSDTMKYPPHSVTPPPTDNFPPGKDLDFELIVPSGDYTAEGSYKSEDAKIQIITSVDNLTSETLNQLDPKDHQYLLSANYQGFFSIIVFNGRRGGIAGYLQIHRIWRDNDVVYILAHFNDKDPGIIVLTIFSSQYEIVKIRKSQLEHLGNFTFILLDEKTVERARSTVNIVQ